eukprot:3250706-Pleurochrysis_carterae.AAC.2
MPEPGPLNGWFLPSPCGDVAFVFHLQLSSTNAVDIVHVERKGKGLVPFVELSTCIDDTYLLVPS